MNLFTVSCIVIPLGLVIGVLYGIISHKKLGRLCIIPKLVCSAVFAALAILAVYDSGENPFLNLSAWAMMLFVLADGLIDINFICGALCFMAGHILIIIWLFPLSSSLWISAAIFIIAMIIMILIFRKALIRDKAKAIPLIIYAASLCAEMSLAVTLPWAHGNAYIMLAVGSVCFFISDIFVGKHELLSVKKWENALIMVLYWSALYLYSATLWII